MGVMKRKNKILWIAWEKQLRSTTLANELGADLYQLESQRPRLLRYLELCIKTINIVVKGKYEYIFVQNPSIILSLLIVALKKFVGNPYVVVDSHTLYLNLKGIKKACFNFIKHIVFSGANLVIVTNTALMQIYRKQFEGGTYYVLPDRIPIFSSAKKIELSKKNNILFICTFSVDEPYHDVFKAMDDLSDSTLYVSGNKDKIPKHIQDSVSENVILTGFLAENRFISLLHSVDIIMVLSTADNCMLCGAYEAVSAGKPLILSDKKVLVDYFNQGVVHTKNSVEDITKNIKLAIQNKETLEQGIRNLKVIRMTEWLEQWNRLCATIGIFHT